MKRRHFALLAFIFLAVLIFSFTYDFESGEFVIFGIWILAFVILFLVFWLIRKFNHRTNRVSGFRKRDLYELEL